MRSPELDLLKFRSAIGDQILRISDHKLKDLVEKAQFHTRQEGVATATCFANWVFELEHKKYIAMPRPISQLAEVRRTIADVLSRNGDCEVGEWALISCDDGSRDGRIYYASCLTKNGKALGMKPDAVWKNTVTGTIAIFEYKVASQWVPVEQNGWPNLVAQLWAYAWADDWKDNPNVLLLGAIFRGAEARLSDIIPRTIKEDPKLNRACSRLFELWGGRIEYPQVSKRFRHLFDNREIQKQARVAEVLQRKNRRAYLEERKRYYGSLPTIQLERLWMEREKRDLEPDEKSLLREVLREAKRITPVYGSRAQACPQCGMVGDNCTCGRSWF